MYVYVTGYILIHELTYFNVRIEYRVYMYKYIFIYIQYIHIKKQNMSVGINKPALTIWLYLCFIYLISLKNYIFLTNNFFLKLILWIIF